MGIGSSSRKLLAPHVASPCHAPMLRHQTEIARLDAVYSIVLARFVVASACARHQPRQSAWQAQLVVVYGHSFKVYVWERHVFLLNISTQLLLLNKPLLDPSVPLVNGQHAFQLSHRTGPARWNSITRATSSTRCADRPFFATNCSLKRSFSRQRTT